MAVTMSGATVEHSARDVLLSKSVDNSFQNGASSSGMFGNEPIVGITASFAANVTGAIDNYVNDIQTILSEISTVQTNEAFKGAGLEGALNNFVESVKTVATNYIRGLRDAENQIINSVAKAYATQDTDISGNINSDSGTLESSNTFNVS